MKTKTQIGELNLKVGEGTVIAVQDGNTYGHIGIQKMVDGRYLTDIACDQFEPPQMVEDFFGIFTSVKTIEVWVDLILRYVHTGGQSYKPYSNYDAWEEEVKKIDSLADVIDGL